MTIEEINFREFGLIESDYFYMQKIFSQFQEIEEIIIFGSRANKNFKPSSDIDLCCKGPHITWTTLASLKSKLQDEGPMPYQIDLLSYESIESKELKSNIDQHGKIFYKSKNDVMRL